MTLTDELEKLQALVDRLKVAVLSNREEGVAEAATLTRQAFAILKGINARVGGIDDARKRRLELAGRSDIP